MDLKQHLLRQMAFSHATFGPGQRTKGVTDHIQKELEEVREAAALPDPGWMVAGEWVDVVILALDGLTRELSYRHGLEAGRADPENTARQAVNLITNKQSANEGRNWPDWRNADPDKAIEHE